MVVTFINYDRPNQGQHIDIDACRCWREEAPNKLLTSSGNSCTLWLVSSWFPPAQRPQRQCAAGELTPVGIRVGQRAGLLLHSHPHIHIHCAPTSCRHMNGGKSAFSWALLLLRWNRLTGLKKRPYLATLSLTWKEMLPNRWSGSVSLSSRCFSTSGPGRCHTSTVVYARVGHEWRRASTSTTDTRMASNTVFLRDRILKTDTHIQYLCCTSCWNYFRVYERHKEIPS